MRYVLVVDDDNRAAIALSRMLTFDGFTADVCTDGHQALQKMQSQHFDVLITDLEMPHIDGLELLRNSRPWLAQTVVYVVTAYAAWQNEGELNHLGVRMQFTKPLDYPALLHDLHLLPSGVTQT